MKSITVLHCQEYSIDMDVDTYIKKIRTYGPEEMDASDGYHTFSELYDHRHALFIAFCHQLYKVSNATAGRYHNLDSGPIWRSKLHSDGSKDEGWFILGINHLAGEQISYHLPLSLWNDTGFAKTLETAPEFDGHSPQEVLKRIRLYQ